MSPEPRTGFLVPWFCRALGVIIIDLLFYGHLLSSFCSEALSPQLLVHEASTKGKVTGCGVTSSRTWHRHFTPHFYRVPAEFSMSLLVGNPLHFPMVKPCRRLSQSVESLGFVTKELLVGVTTAWVSIKEAVLA